MIGGVAAVWGTIEASNGVDTSTEGPKELGAGEDARRRG